jgi:membrane protease YdiL (CAAX protease family)
VSRASDALTWQPIRLLRPHSDTAPGISPPWRLAVFLLATTASVLLLRFAHSLVARWIPVEARPVAFVVVLALALLMGHAWTFREMDRRGWQFIGLGREHLNAGHMARSAALAAAAVALPCALLIAAGWLQFESGESSSVLGAAVASLALLIPASLWEELLLRGYAFQVVRERWGDWGAIAATSLVFGAIHYLNAGATPGALAVVILAGVFLGLVLVRTGSLYATWAAHLAWNATLVVVLHATVSGLTLDAPGYVLVDSGPDWATGGAWGPEGGLFAALGIVGAIAIISRRPPGRVGTEA